MRALGRASAITSLALLLGAGCSSTPEPRGPAAQATVGGETRTTYERERHATSGEVQARTDERAMMHDPGEHEHGMAGQAGIQEGMAQGGAGAQGDTARGSGATGAQGDALGSMCPMLTSTTNVAVEDVDQGVALRFTAESPSDVEALRGHVRHMASMPGWSRPADTGRRGSMQAMRLPPATATVVEIPQGARLELRARAPQEVDTLRARTRIRAERMRTGECPMMQASAPRTTDEPG